MTTTADTVLAGLQDILDEGGLITGDDLQHRHHLLENPTAIGTLYAFTCRRLTDPTGLSGSGDYSFGLHRWDDNWQ